MARVGSPPIDRDALHRYLYRRTDHFGRYRMNLKQLSTDLDLSYCNLSVVIGSMAKEGRLRIIAGPTYGPKTYRLEDPAAWRFDSGYPRLARLALASRHFLYDARLESTHSRQEHFNLIAIV